MKKTIMIAVLVLVLGGVTAYAVTVKKKDTQNPLTTQPNTTSNERSSSPAPKTDTTIVTYDNNGFSPESIEITKGTTVNFVNKSDMPLWVASDPHPEHTIYPEFDTIVATNGEMPELGQDFSFKFEKTGTWKYHSHTASSHVDSTIVHPGIVTVK